MHVCSRSLLVMCSLLKPLQVTRHTRTCTRPCLLLYSDGGRSLPLLPSLPMVCTRASRLTDRASTQLDRSTLAHQQPPYPWVHPPSPHHWLSGLGQVGRGRAVCFEMQHTVNQTENISSPRGGTACPLEQPKGQKTKTNQNSSAARDYGHLCMTEQQAKSCFFFHS